MADVVLKVCDLCGAEGATSWRLGRVSGGMVDVDLCDPCAAPLEEVRAAGRKPPGARGPYKRFQKTPLKPQPGEKTPRKGRTRG